VAEDRGKPIVNIPYTQECNDVANDADPAPQGVGILRRAMDQFEQIYAMPKTARG